MAIFHSYVNLPEGNVESHHFQCPVPGPRRRSGASALVGTGGGSHGATQRDEGSDVGDGDFLGWDVASGNQPWQWKIDYL